MPEPASAHRYIGVDAARGLAILGMLVLHALPPESAPLLEAIAADGRPQILFAVLDGIALGLLSRGAASRGEARRRIASRAVLLVAIGLFLTGLGSGVVVILDSYGVYFLLALPVLFARTWILAAGAGLLLLVGPPIVFAVSGLPGTAEYVPLTAQVEAWFVNGVYPAIIWFGYVLTGMVVERLGLLASRRAPWLAGGGLLVWAVLSTLHGWIAPSAATGVVSAVLWGATVASTVALVTTLGWLLDVPRRGDWSLRRLSSPLVALGAMPITIYVLHVVALAVIARFTTNVQSVPAFIALVVGAVLFAALWRRALGKGPLERLAAWLPGADRIRTAEPTPDRRAAGVE